MTRNHRDISNSDDVIDSRDVIERIEELRDEIESAEVPDNEIGGPDDPVASERDELASLEALAEKGESSPDWQHGETLIRDSYFQRYAEEFAEELYGRDVQNATWPFTCIDWEQAAAALQVDYFDVDFDGVTYWIRG